MAVLVCIKRVPEASAEVTLTPDGQAVDGRYVGFTTSAHEECAIEIATQLGPDLGGATVLTIGPGEASEQLRSALSLGCTAATHVVAETHELGPADVAREIAAVVRDHEAQGTTYDVILLGNDAADSGDFQVGIRLAYLLDRPVVNGAATVSVADGVVTARADGPDGFETYQVPAPAVVTILEGGVAPRYPTISGRVKAKKIEIETREPAGTPTGPKRVRLTLPPPVPNQVQVLGEGKEAAGALVDVLHGLGVGR
jgi:electron transfer flavoprotein beta subunit